MTTTETPPRTGWRPPTPMLIIAGLVAFVVVAALLASTSESKEPPQVTPSEVAEAIAGDPVKVHISLAGGPGSAEATFSVGSDTSQRSVAVPLTMNDGTEGLDVEATPGTFIYFSAQASDDGIEMECTMTAYGRTIAHAATAVDYGIVTCSASIPAA